MDFVVVLGAAAYRFFIYPSNAHGLVQVQGRLSIFTPLSVMRRARLCFLFSVFQEIQSLVGYFQIVYLCACESE